MIGIDLDDMRLSPRWERGELFGVISTDIIYADNIATISSNILSFSNLSSD